MTDEKIIELAYEFDNGCETLVGFARKLLAAQAVEDGLANKTPTHNDDDDDPFEPYQHEGLKR